MNVIILIYIVGIILCTIIYPIEASTDFRGDIRDIMRNIIYGFVLGLLFPLMIIILPLRKLVKGYWI